MFGKDAILWKKYFGLAWNEMSELAPDVGRYALFADSKSYELDANAKRLTGFEGEPSYDLVLSLLKRLKSDNSAHVAVKELFADSATAIGYIYEKKDLSAANTLSLCTVNRLITAMSQSQSRSLLALIQLEEKTGRHGLSDMHVYEILTVIMETVSKDALICNLGQGKLWLYIPDFSGDDVLYLTDVKKKVESYSLTSLGKEGGGKVTFTAGCAATLSSPVQRMNTAKFTLFEAEARGFGTILAYSVDRYEDKKNEFARIEQFSSLLDRNLFRYHFQPIISAHTGEIVAYELLMRSGGGIEMYPLEILDYAKKYDRLYDIEKATFFNGLHVISENQQQFSSKKLFINSISDHILNKEDWDRLLSDYGELLEKVVIELTEQSEITDEQLETVKNRIAYSNMELAIDDYGTGYSNTSNLMRYNPSYVKIDRQLIADIDSNPKIQKLVSSIIEFVHVNGFQALAEGVETYEELKTSIGLGCDLIQGFYVSKPKPFILYELSESIRDEIVKINLEFASDIEKIYHPKNCETVDLVKIASEHYTMIFVETERVIIEGGGKNQVNMNIVIKDSLKTKVTLRGCLLITDKDDPIITLGAGSKVDLDIDGRNELLSKGIFVPGSADLTLTGEGTLRVKADAASAFAIGTDINTACGNITSLIDGQLIVEANGDNSVGIGGGRNDNGNFIKIFAGHINVNASGGTCVGIGIHHGPANIVMSDCGVDVKISSAICCAIGALEGEANISLENISIGNELSGMNLCGIGSGKEGSGKVRLSSGRMECSMSGRNINCVGTRAGDMDIDITHAAIKYYCEGGNISGIGDSEGGGDVHITESELCIEFRTAEGFGLGSKTGKLDVIDCRKEISINK